MQNGPCTTLVKCSLVFLPPLVYMYAGGEALFVEDPNPDHTLHPHPDHTHPHQPISLKEQDGHVTSTSGGDEGDGGGDSEEEEEEGGGRGEEEEEDGVREDVEEEESRKIDDEEEEEEEEEEEKLPKPKASGRHFLRRVRRVSMRRGLRHLATRRKRTPYKI